MRNRAGLDGGSSAVSTCDGVLGSSLGAVLNRDADGQTIAWTMAVIFFEILGHREGALGCVTVALQGEERAVLDLTRWAGAGVDGFTKELGRVPAHHEVGVVAGSDGIAGGEDELARHSSELLGGKNGLEEEEWVVDVITFGAVTFLDERWVGDVRSVIVGVDLTRAARWKGHFEAQTIDTVVVHLILGWKDVAVERGFGLFAIVQAVEADGALLEEELIGRIGGPQAQLLIREGTGKVAVGWVSGDHLEAFGEGLEVIKVEQVVCEHASHVLDHFDLTVAVLKVQWRGPVGGLVLNDTTRCAVVLFVGALGQVLVGRVHAKVCVQQLVQARRWCAHFMAQRAQTHFHLQKQCAHGQRHRWVQPEGRYGQYPWSSDMACARRRRHCQRGRGP